LLSFINIQWKYYKLELYVFSSLSGNHLFFLHIWI
jgi:hypothetical protein